MTWLASPAHTPVMEATVNAVRLSDGDGVQLVIDASAPRPRPGKGELLIRVRAAGVTPTELIWYPTLHSPTRVNSRGLQPCSMRVCYGPSLRLRFRFPRRPRRMRVEFRGGAPERLWSWWRWGTKWAAARPMGRAPLHRPSGLSDLNAAVIAADSPVGSPQRCRVVAARPRFLS